WINPIGAQTNAKDLKSNAKYSIWDVSNVSPEQEAVLAAIRSGDYSQLDPEFFNPYKLHGQKMRIYGKTGDKTLREILKTDLGMAADAVLSDQELIALAEENLDMLVHEYGSLDVRVKEIDMKNETGISNRQVPKSSVRFKYLPSKKLLVIQAIMAEHVSGEYFIPNMDIATFDYDQEEFFLAIGNDGKGNAIDMGWVQKNLFNRPIPVFTNIIEFGPVTQESLKEAIMSNQEDGQSLQLKIYTPGLQPADNLDEIDNAEITSEIIVPRNQEGKAVYNAGDFHLLDTRGHQRNILSILSRKTLGVKIKIKTAILVYLSVMQNPKSISKELLEKVLEQLANEELYVQETQKLSALSGMEAQVSDLLKSLGPVGSVELARRIDVHSNLSSRAVDQQTSANWQDMNQQLQSLYARIKNTEGQINPNEVIYRKNLDAIEENWQDTEEANLGPIWRALYAELNAVSIEHGSGHGQDKKVKRKKISEWIGEGGLLSLLKNKWTWAGSGATLAGMYYLLNHTPWYLQKWEWAFPWTASVVMLASLYPIAKYMLAPVTVKSLKAVSNIIGLVSTKAKKRLDETLKKYSQMTAWQALITFNFRIQARVIWPFWNYVFRNLLNNRTTLIALREAMNPFKKYNPQEVLGEEKSSVTSRRLGWHSPIVIATIKKKIKIGQREFEITVPDMEFEKSKIHLGSKEVNIPIPRIFHSSKTKRENIEHEQFELMNAVVKNRQDNFSLAYILSALAVSEKTDIDPASILQAMRGDLGTYDLSDLYKDGKLARTWRLTTEAMYREIVKANKGIKPGQSLEQLDAQQMSEIYARALTVANKIKQQNILRRKAADLRSFFWNWNKKALRAVIGFNDYETAFLREVIASKFVSGQTDREFLHDHGYVVGLPAVVGPRIDEFSPERWLFDPEGSFASFYTNPQHLYEVGSNTNIHLVIASSTMVLLYQGMTDLYSSNYKPSGDISLRGMELSDSFSRSSKSFALNLADIDKSNIGGMWVKMLRNSFVRIQTTFLFGILLRSGIAGVPFGDAVMQFMFYWLAQWYYFAWVWLPIQLGSNLYEGEMDEKAEEFLSKKESLHRLLSTAESQEDIVEAETQLIELYKNIDTKAVNKIAEQFKIMSKALGDDKSRAELSTMISQLLADKNYRQYLNLIGAALGAQMEYKDLQGQEGETAAKQKMEQAYLDLRQHYETMGEPIEKIQGLEGEKLLNFALQYPPQATIAHHGMLHGLANMGAAATTLLGVYLAVHSFEEDMFSWGNILKWAAIDAVSFPIIYMLLGAKPHNFIKEFKRDFKEKWASGELKENARLKRKEISNAIREELDIFNKSCQSALSSIIKGK
ncbi:MAG: hypothetical protein KDD40_01770, partial [Bdellovibrionales bacterium]|nr:hypothetical protein [Bdellovibrionales bacterium]